MSGAAHVLHPESSSAQPSWRILVVDDDHAVATVLVATLARAQLDASHAASGEEALKALDERAVDLVLTDMRMPGMSGLDLLARVSERWPDISVIMLTAHGSVRLAVDAMRAGAADFILKPFDRDEILFVVNKALQSRRHGVERPPDGPLRAGPFSTVAPAMREVVELLARAARSPATVLIRGETGTGKELAARAIHEMSSRRAGPFVAVHCAALPDALLESELFGYEKGAFTGATFRKPGRVELAEGGTLLLDEIGDVSPQIQIKLLRVVQERAFERLGGTQTVRADVRLVAATHQDLEAMVRAKTFREDLFYRLNVVPIFMPPLRARPEDIAALAAQFASTLGAAHARPGVRLDGAALERLREQRWPGNVRELQNVIERLVVFSDGSTIGVADVDRELARGSSHAGGPLGGEATLDARRRGAEAEALRAALERTGGNRQAAARILGVSRRTLFYKLAEYGIAVPPGKVD